MKKTKLIQLFLSIILGVLCVIILIDINLLPFIIPCRQNKIYEKYYQKSYSDRANVLVKQKKYLEAVDVLNEGLKLVNNTHLTSNVIEIHKEIIDLCLDAKDFDRAKYELKKFVSLTQRNEMIQNIHIAVLHFCYKINDLELTQQYTNDIINYHLKVLDKSVKNKNTYAMELHLHLYSFFYILRYIEDSEQAFKIAKNILALSKDKNSPYKRLKPYAYNEFIDLLCNINKQSLAIKSLQEVIKSSVELRIKIESYIKLAEIYQDLEQYSIANIILEKTVKLIDKIGARHDKQGDYYQYVGWIFFNIKEFSKAISCFHKAILCAQDFKDKIKYRLNIVEIHVNAKQYSLAKIEIEKILRDIFQINVERRSKNYFLYRIINLYARIDAYDIGIKTLRKLQTKAKKQDDKNILHEYANKLKDLKKSKKGHSEDKNIMQIYENAVHLTLRKGQLKQAETKLIKVVHELESQKPLNVYNLGLAYFYLWECNKTSERADKSKKYLLEALAEKNLFGYFNTKDPGVYSLLGELYLYEKNYKVSIAYNYKFLGILKKLKLDANLTRTYRDLSIAYSKEKDYKNALIYIKKSLDEFPVSKDYKQQINRAGLSLFLIEFLCKNNKKEEAKIRLNNLKEQISKIPEDYKYAKKILVECDIFQKQLEK